MSFSITQDQMRKLAYATTEEKLAFLSKLTAIDALRFDADFEAWAHKNQLPPPDKFWRVWLMMAGRGFGKTRAGAEWICGLANAKPDARIALIGATIAEARTVMVEGVSGLLAVAKLHRRRIEWEPSLGRLRWPNGSQAQLFSGDNADGLRGPEFDFAWADELAKWRQAEAAWDNLQFGLRRGPRPRVLVTTTPRPIQLLKRIGESEWTMTTRGKTSDNINLDAKVVEMMTASYAGTRIGRQELDGELIEDVEGALWTRELIEECRVSPLSPAPLRTGERGSWIGLSLAWIRRPGSAKDRTRAGSWLRDRWAKRSTCSRMQPCGASAPKAGPTGSRRDTRLVVAEANNGGEMVRSVLKAADLGLKVRLVHASKGKSARAEPVALKFEAGKAHFAGEFRELEDELAGMQAGGGYEGPGRSPDRADAMVWALTALSETRSGVPRVRRL